LTLRRCRLSSNWNFLRSDSAHHCEKIADGPVAQVLNNENEIRAYLGSLSGGEQELYAFARGLMTSPQLIIIDEMSLGLAPLIVDDLVDIVREINQQGTSVLPVEQDVQLALDNSHYGYVISTGRIVMEGESEALLGKKEIKEINLGL
jgi:ABC-type branched-subunit amino acid transport system ATPase component